MIMATDQFVLTENPGPPVQFVRVDRSRYSRIRESMLEILRAYGPMTLNQLCAQVEVRSQQDFNGHVSWYCAMVKWDLEACGVLRNVPGANPPQIEIA